MANTQSGEVDFFSALDELLTDKPNEREEKDIEELSLFLFKELNGNNIQNDTLEDLLRSPIDFQNEDSAFVPLNLINITGGSPTEQIRSESDNLTQNVDIVQDNTDTGEVICDSTVTQNEHIQTMEVLSKQYNLELDWKIIHRHCHDYLVKLPNMEGFTFSPEAMLCLQDCAEDMISRIFKNASKELVNTQRTVVLKEDFVKGMSWLDWCD